MLELIGWNVGMSLTAAVLLVAGALIIGLAAHFIGRVTVGWEWAATGLAALVGAYVGSEAFGTFSTWGPVFDGLYIVPALIGAVVLGFVVDAALRYTTEGSYATSPHARPI